MAVTRRTIDLLPNIFRTDVNKKFLGSSLDQLVSEPQLTKINGFIGRKFSPNFGVSDNYLVEPNDERTNYQLEPAIVVNNTDDTVNLLGDYPDLINKIKYYGGNADNHDRLFGSEYYTFDPRIDLDKFVNYSQYYWLPNGPDPITISNGGTVTASTYIFTQTVNGYTTNRTGATVNPTLYLSRGNSYAFTVNHSGSGNLWIQSEPGTNGQKLYLPKVSSRVTQGITNNGQSSGIITFTVPVETVQDYYLSIPLVDDANYATSTTFSQLDGSLWTQGSSSIDGDTQFPKDRYIIFLSTSVNSADWTDRNGFVVSTGQRYGLWKINVNHLKRIELTHVRSIAVDRRVKISDGNVNEGNQYLRTSSGYSLIPNITAPLTTLYYQNDSVANQSGEIRIVETEINSIDVDRDIVGARVYTSPDGVKFSNGMKIYFDSTILPVGYREKTYIVEGVGTAIRLIDFQKLITPEIKGQEQNVAFDTVNFDIGGFDATLEGTNAPDYIVINRSSLDQNAWSRINRWFHIDVITETARINKNIANPSNADRAKRPIIEFDADLQLFNNGRLGLSIIDQLFDSNVFLNDSGNLVKLNNALTQINFLKFADLSVKGIELKQGQQVVFANDNDLIVRKTVYRVDYVNQTVTSSGSSLTGTVDGRVGSARLSGSGTNFLLQLTEGTDLYKSDWTYIGRVRTIFTNEYLVLENSLTVNYTNLSGVKYNLPKISLVGLSVAQPYDSLVVKSGANQKRTYFLNTSGNWQTAQLKTSINQEPLFDIINANDISMTAAYADSDFAGTKLFSYARGYAVDTVLGFDLSYNGSSNSIGQLNFTNNYETDTFSYLSNSLTKTRTNINPNIGFIRKITGRYSYQKLNFWNRVQDITRQYQHVSYTYDGISSYFELGQIPELDTVDTPTVKVYVNNRLLVRDREHAKFASVLGSALTTTYTGANAAVFATTINQYFANYLGQYPNQITLDSYVGLVYANTETLSEVKQLISNLEQVRRLAIGYSVETIGVRHAVKINTDLIAVGDKIDILFYSSKSSAIAYYEIPKNLEFNAQNQIVTTVTLGQLRNHLQKIGENTRGLIGSILNNSNVRDLDIDHKPGTILQHSAPTVYSSLFLLDSQVNFISAIDYARRAYTQFKNKFLELAVSLPTVNANDTVGSVDLIIENINAVKNKDFAWYYSDMIPNGKNFNQTAITVLNPSVKTYNLTKSYYNLTVGNQAVLIYLNGRLLIKDRDYKFDPAATITMTAAITLAINDVVVVKEYTNTDGCYVPETPSKLGLYPKFIPEKFLDSTYRTATQVIQGHDGSITIAFGDYRDDLLLELEKRIYNNIKINYNPEIFNIIDNTPGKFRTTDYSQNEYNQILNTEFLKWVGYNQLDSATNTYYLGNDEFSWNYGSSIDRDDQTVPGYWRGIYRYYYDTDRPHTHPWEIMGLSLKPDWWDTYYSWTNSVKRSTLIFNISNGFVNQPGSANALVADPNFVRPGFSGRVPVDASGNLLSPLSTTIKQFNDSYFDRPFAIGDQGPVESAWRRSSEYAFAVQRAMALMKPAEYFGRNIDVSRLIKDASIDQYIYSDTHRRPGSQDIKINGQGTSRAVGYLNWIHGYVTSLGIDAADKIRSMLDNLQIKLVHKMAGFTDKNYIQVISEQSSPTSVSESVIIPDENYQIYLGPGVPIERAVYSAVIVERSSNGYTVSGYDLKYPYFIVVPSETAGLASEIGVLDQRVIVFEDFRSEKLAIPYGYEFTSGQQVADFLISYERWLIAQGFVFGKYNNDLGLVQDFKLAIREFLTWAKQGWQPGNIIVLSPMGDSIDLYSDTAMVDHVTNRIHDSRLMGVNFNIIKNTDFSIIRDNNLTSLFTISGQTIAFAELNLVQYDHTIIFDNTTVFNDIIYKPNLGNRQYRLRLVGTKTSGWDGQLTPPGFVYNNGQVSDWQIGQDYRKGDIVYHKGKNYTAAQNVVASDQFDYNYWTPLDSTLKNGLSANFSHSAVRSQNFYDVDNQPLDEQLARFSNGLIGFRSRSWMDNLAMSSISQTKFYQGYIKEKGTTNAVMALAGLQINGQAGQISVHEEWAARLGEFGALDANPTISIVLNDSAYRDRPMAFELVDDNTPASDVNIPAIAPKNVLNKPQGYKPNIFLNRNPMPPTIFKIELFGDGIMCGRDPGSLSGSSLQSLVACLDDKVSGRVTYPPDFLLYQALNTEFSLAITTRSVENTSSQQLLLGTDGVNQAWPNDIEADIVVINHGMIDAKNGVNIADYKSNLRALRNGLRRDQTVVWQTPTLVNRSLPTTDWSLTGTNDVAIYAEAMRAVAKEYNDILADAAAIQSWTSYLGTNGVYPTQAGYAKLVNEVLAPAVRQSIVSRVRKNIRIFENDVKSAGYVNSRDVDGQLFDLLDYSSLYSSILADLTTGYKLWVAKDFDDDWQVYRAYKNLFTVTTVRADIDNKIVFTTSRKHGLSVGDILAIRGLVSDVDGFYQALAVDQLDITVIASNRVFEYIGNQIIVSDTALLFDFQKLRFRTRDLLDAALPKHGWLNSDKVWVDDINDPTGSWAVYDRVDSYRITANASTIVNGNSILFSVSTVSPNETVYYNIVDASIAEALAPKSSWQIIDRQQSQVDIDSINNVYLFSGKRKEILARLDILDPAKGRVLGPALANLDYTTSIDPAKYSHSRSLSDILPTSTDYFWAAAQVGKYWWNIDTCRFIDYEQSTLTYRLNNWAKLFPGSTISVYEWIESDVLPSQHVAQGRPGVPLYVNDDGYSQSSFVDSATNVITTKYYFWIHGHSSISSVDKTMSSLAVESMIAEPDQQGIPYLVALKDNAIALFNVGSYLNGNDTQLYISYKTVPNQLIVHSEYQLVEIGNSQSTIPIRIENKIIDSLIGQDLAGFHVPSPGLYGEQRLGLAIRPKQTVIIDARLARENLVKYVNRIIKQGVYSNKLINGNLIASKNFYDAEKEPKAGTYQHRVSTYSKIHLAPAGTNDLILVKQDETQKNYWTVYKKTNIGYQLVKRQGYDTTKYWSFVDWYQDGFNSATNEDYTVNQYQDIYRLNLVAGDVVKVLNASIAFDQLINTYRTSKQTVGKFELYRIDSINDILTPVLVGLGQGTFELSRDLYASRGFDSQAFDSDDFDLHSMTEMRKIMQGLKSDVFVNDLAKNYNQLMFSMINLILSEQKYIDWFFKTSFIRLLYQVDGLQQNPGYIRDRQSAYENYVREVKPYRTKIRDFTLSYGHLETPALAVTDFDLPAYYDHNLQVYRSPNGESPIVDNLELQKSQYQDWVNNYKYELENLAIAHSGYGYRNGNAVPTVSIIRSDSNLGSDAEALLYLNSEIGGISKLSMTKFGSNYTLTPTVSVNGNGGTSVSDLKTYKFRVVSVGANDTSGTVSFGLYNMNTNLQVFNGTTSGYIFHRIRRVDGQIVFTRQYNIVNENNAGYTGYTTADLVADLNDTGSSHLVVLHTYGDASANRLNNFMEQALYRCGASKEIFGSTTLFKTNSAYALIGIPGSGQGYGLESYSGSTNNSTTSYVSIDFSLRRGHFIPTAMSPKTSGSDFVYTTSLTSDMVPHYAVISPRLKNHTIRKIKTVIRFDRIQYNTQVVEWIPSGYDATTFDPPPFDQTFPAGTFVTYLGECYISDGSARLTPLTFPVVGSQQPVSSRTYRQGYFDNANDRITAYYQPTAEMVPKNLSRLIPGIGLIATNYGSSGSGSVNTILIGDTFSSMSGIPASNITVTGGAFVNAIFSHAPEEFMPGQTFESLQIRVMSNVSFTGYHLFKSLAGNIYYYNRSNVYITTLAQTLNLTDTTAIVTNGAALATPNPLLIDPGIIYVNGERIAYYTKVGNTLGQLNRGYGGTGAALVHPIGSTVENVSSGVLNPTPQT